MKYSPTFMSRDQIRGYYQDSNFSTWLVKEYSQGAIFQAARTYHSLNLFNDTDKGTTDYLECIDEEGCIVLLKLLKPGRFSLIASFINPELNQLDKFLYSTQTIDISNLIDRSKLDKNDKNNDCVRLVRGSLPYKFVCQYLQFVHKKTYDVLIGLTKQGLLVEWNLDSHSPCRFATNLNDVLAKLYGTWDNHILEKYIDDARTHYRANFRLNMQLISPKDYTAFLQYWKWTGDLQKTNRSKDNISYHTRHQFHLIASIQVVAIKF